MIINKHEEVIKRSRCKLNRDFIMFVVAILFLGGIFGTSIYIAYYPNQVYVHENNLIIDGMYGITWDVSEIRELRLLDQLPSHISRKNGVTFGDRSRGKFALEEIGTGKLFVHRSKGPFIIY